MEEIKWFSKKLEELSARELHKLLQFRVSVFVVEQNCPYQECDDKDLKAIHLFGQNRNGEIVACARILPPGVSYSEPSVGRVAVHADFRMGGIGNEVMRKTIRFIEEFYNEKTIRISAQQYLKQFYSDLGFEQVSEMYLEDDIPHIEMLRRSN
ncbi:GNAT family N-acetyltransferase [Salibacter sp.]|uniref:GNAT family N-acetyltransferase n=1 Tax=Salibacter sp. TaxID=2010995 RepID=UPI00286FF78A|nr:GNAT family N-acetyltransferase [Salibacter sp.]MDR9399592.1 GNAT family N-acetyltransferase [Salibacter sp.]MDR9488565.1 GNAT family N-acetyltransferase [Salibacter sp.]